MDACVTICSDAWRRFCAALRYVVHVDSWLALAVLGLAIALLDQFAAFPLPGAALGLPVAEVLWVGYFYLALRKAGEGSRRLPRLGDYRDTWNAVLAPLFRAALVGIWYGIFLAITVASTVGFQDFIERLHGSPVALLREDHLLLYLFFAVELVYLPAALLASCSSAKSRRLLDPSFGFRYAMRIGDRYVAVFLGLCLFSWASFVASSAALVLTQVMPIPLVAATLGQVLQLWVPLAEVRLLGDLAAEVRGGS
ncbi:MAG: hypothetical protein KAI47_12705 [Deltaproteobacteria bacterium]|nr:hypothetical protein [Deltaproteobacteria bacterium]